MLSTIWFALIGVLVVGYIVMDGFDLGTGILYPFIARSEVEKRGVLRSIGPVWDGNEVWLLTAGGALFAAFPAVYATVFSGFYLALMLVLFCLILRAGALEFRTIDPAWKKFWDGAFFLASALSSFLVGVAAGNLIRGVPLAANGEYAGNFFTLLNPFALLVGVVSFIWITLHGASWLSLKTTDAVRCRAMSVRKHATLALVIALVVTTVLAPMFASHAFATGSASPIALSGAAIAVVGAILSMVYGAQSIKSNQLDTKSDFIALIGSALVGAGAVVIWAGSVFPNMLPALNNGAYDAARSLTIQASASSNLTLLVMLIIAGIGVPLVLFYTALIYKTYAGRVEPVEETDGHY